MSDLIQLLIFEEISWIASLKQVLEKAGYRVVLVPVLSFNFINQERVVPALCDHHSYLGVIFTSPRSVQAVTRLLPDVRDKGAQLNPESLRCFVVGQATEDKAKEAGFITEGAETGNAEKLAKFILGSVDKDEQRALLYPCAQMRRDTLLDYLQGGGCSVEEIVAYETCPSPNIMGDLSRVFASEHHPDSVVFFSPSGVQFTETAVAEGVLPIKSLKVYALGPTTQQAIVSHGYHLTGVAERPDPTSLLQLLQQT